MIAVRRSLGRLGIICLCWQAVTMSLPVAVMWTTGIPNCTCATGDHAMCPMHHSRSNTGCAMRAAEEDSGSMLVPAAVVGLLPPASPTGIVTPLSAEAAPEPDYAVSAFQIPPDSPPPRA